MGGQVTTRVLSQAEYGKLAGTDLAAIVPHLPVMARVLVVEDAGAIVASWALFPVWHAEGISIDPAYRTRPTASNSSS